MNTIARRPVLYLLTGLPCSGKTTHALKLESSGALRVSVDDMLIESAGRLGIDYDSSDHTRLLEPIVAAAKDRASDHLAAGQDVVFDHGLGSRAERDEFRRFAEERGASWTLFSFDADLETLHARCLQRSQDSETVPISPGTLDSMAASWEPPDGEGEIVIRTN